MDQPSLPFSGRRPGDSGVIRMGPRAVVVARFVREPRAKRYLLRVEADGTLRVTIPRGGSRAEAEAFAARHAAWVQRQRYLRLRNSAGREPLGDGRAVLVNGERVALSVHDAGGRRVVTLGEWRLSVPAGTSDLRPFVQRLLQQVASRELPSRLRELARRHSLPVSRVTVRNQRSRWGSCSPRGVIALNWRLVQMPADVRDYVLLHELMHLRERNHSPRFWALVARACPGQREARAWLKTHEDELG